MDEHYLYLTNLGDRDVFPDNKPSRFKNRIQPPINLNPDIKYEVGLVSCLFPQNYNCLSNNDPEGCITIMGQYRNRDFVILRDFIVHRYTPQMDIEAGDINYIVTERKKEYNDTAARREKHSLTTNK